MALTPEQKAANKQAAQARDAAYRARRKEYTAAYDAMVAPYEFYATSPAPEVLAYREVDRLLERALSERNAADVALVRQIEALDAARVALRAAPLPYAREREEAAEHVRQLLAEKTQTLSAGYPDIAGVYSAVAWEDKVKRLRAEGVL